MEQAETTTTQAEIFAEAAKASEEAEIARKQASKPPRSFTEKMPCRLTDVEIESLKAKVLEQYDEIERIDEERKNVSSGFRARMNLIRESIREHRATLRSGCEDRDVELIEEFVFATNTVRVSRADTRELIRERAMTQGERQGELQFEQADDNDVEALDVAEAIEFLRNPGNGTKVSHGWEGDLHPVDEDEADQEEVIDDPEALLANAAEDPDAPKPKRTRRRRQ